MYQRTEQLIFCFQSYSTVDKDRLSLHFFLMERDEKASGTITVYDGTSTISPVLGVFPVSNGSFPQSVTTSGRSITIRFQYNLPPEPSIPGQHRCKNFRACLRFLLDLVSYDGKKGIRMLHKELSCMISCSKMFLNNTSKCIVELGIIPCSTLHMMIDVMGHILVHVYCFK